MHTYTPSHTHTIILILTYIHTYTYLLTKLINNVFECLFVCSYYYFFFLKKLAFKKIKKKAKLTCLAFSKSVFSPHLYLIHGKKRSDLFVIGVFLYIDIY